MNNIFKNPVTPGTLCRHTRTKKLFYVVGIYDHFTIKSKTTLLNCIIMLKEVFVNEAPFYITKEEWDANITIEGKDTFRFVEVVKQPAPIIPVKNMQYIAEYEEKELPKLGKITKLK